MANQQTTGNKRRATQESPAPRGPSSSNAAARRAAAAPVERDETYGLISVIHHSLQGSETVSQYLEDARRANDDELVGFFERCKRQHDALALAGKRLLGSYLAEMAEEDEDESDDEDDDEDEDEDEDDEDEDEES
jgi:hypothetical protein